MADGRIGFEDLFGDDTNRKIQELENSLKELDKAMKSMLGTMNKMAKANLAESMGKVDETVDVKVLQDAVKLQKQFVAQKKEVIAVEKKHDEVRKEAVGTLGKLRDAQKGNRKELEQLNLETKTGKDRFDSLSREMRDNQKEIKDITDATRRSTSALAAAEGSYDSLSQQLRGMKRELRENTKNWEKNADGVFRLSKRGNETARTISKLDKELKDIDNTLGDNFRNVGNYKDSLQPLADQMGALGSQIVGALGGTGAAGGGGLVGLTGAMGAGLGPIGLVVGGVGALAAGLGQVTQEVAQARKEFIKFSSVTGEMGKTGQITTARIRSMAKIFDKDFNEVMRSANVVVNEFGVTFDEALDIIEEGFVQGADASDEFLDVLREYSTQFATIGISLEDFNKLNIAAAQQGIFQDKAQDAVKELAIRLQDLTPATEELLDQLGDVGVEIREQMAGGDTIGAIQLLVSTINQLESEGKNVQKFISDFGGGPLEDLGKRGRELVATFGDLNLELNDSQKIIQDQLDITEDYDQAVQDLSVSWNVLATVGDKLFEKAFTPILNALALLIDRTGQLQRESFRLVQEEDIKSLDDANQKIIETQEEIDAVQLKIEELNNSMAGGLAAPIRYTDELASLQGRLEALFEVQSVWIPVQEKNEDNIDTTTVALEEQKKAVQKLIDQYKELSNIVGKEMPDDFLALEGQAELSTDAIAGAIQRVLDDTEQKNQFDKAKKRLDDWRQAWESTLQGLVMGVQGAFQIIENTQARSFAVQLENLQAQQDAELESAEGNAEAQAQINQEFADKRKALENEAARREKKLALFRISIETALNVIKALGLPPIPGANIPAAVQAAIQGAVQLAVVAAAPVPQAAEGMESAPGGPVIVGEKGRELIKTPGGKVMLTGSKAHLTDVPKGSQIIPADVTADMIENFEAEKGLEGIMKISKGLSEGAQSDVGKLLELQSEGNKDLLSAIEDQKQFMFNVSKNGLQVMMKHRGNRTIYYDERYG